MLLMWYQSNHHYSCYRLFAIEVRVVLTFSSLIFLTWNLTKCYVSFILFPKFEINLIHNYFDSFWKSPAYLLLKSRKRAKYLFSTRSSMRINCQETGNQLLYWWRNILPSLLIKTEFTLQRKAFYLGTS